MAPRENSSRAPAHDPAHGSVDKAAVGSSANVLVDTDEDYRIGAGDVIEVEVEDAPELSGNFRVTAAGTFLMHYLGRIDARNKTTEELARFIANGLRERYIFDPRVIVTVRQYNSRAFFIQGAVHGAGVFQIEGRPSLLELITLAGGLQQNHSSTAFIIRKIRPPATAPATVPDGTQDTPAQYTLLKVNINGLLKGRFEQNMFLEPGDIVNIPPTEVFFVAGEVKQPGSFPLKEGTTLRQAISLAQGMNFTAAAGKGIIFRENADSGKRQEITVDVGAVMSAKKEDVVLLPNDIILIPNSKMKKVAGPIISAFATNAIMLPMRY
ncbi:MAG: polysaccharide biosynthesis/export family protein [Blastocatellia bacterium]